MITAVYTPANPGHLSWENVNSRFINWAKENVKKQQQEIHHFAKITVFLKKMNTIYFWPVLKDL